MRTRNILTSVAVLLSASSVIAADYYSQNFDGMGTGTTAPAGWSMWYINGDSSSATVPSSAQMAGAVAGSSTLVVWDATMPAVSFENQAANESLTSGGANRLLGTSAAATMGSVLQLSLANSSAAPITTVSISYDMQFMAAGMLKDGYSPTSTAELPGYSLFIQDGGGWVHVASLDLATSGTASGTYNLSTAVPVGGNLLLRWFGDNATAFNPDAMYAIDNIIVNIPEPSTLGLLTIAGLAVLLRRKS